MKLIAIGNTAEVFDMEDGTVCKLFKQGYDKNSIQLEISNTRIINETSLNTPKFFKQVEIEDRTGVIYSKIEGTSLLQESETCQTPEQMTALLQDLANLQKQLHINTTTEGISYKDYLSFFGCKNIENLPEGNIICHGDFHPGNIIRTAENNLFLIDFMNLCRGPKEYDIARTYVLLTEYIPDPQLKAFIGNTYLSLMQKDFSEVEPFLEAIENCRKQEML
ncbi:phosphotransferase [Treponema sp.]|uniref:phosphotransferase n=1 Tax=Treponema sp. TaxID=166 RepID=UPI00298DF73D|nr:phosphotransferase [Treponema sp.]MCQ2241695.1 phosphotransferase [Treponema sp.]